MVVGLHLDFWTDQTTVYQRRLNLKRGLFVLCEKRVEPACSRRVFFLAGKFLYSSRVETGSKERAKINLQRSSFFSAFHAINEVTASLLKITFGMAQVGFLAAPDGWRGIRSNQAREKLKFHCESQPVSTALPRPIRPLQTNRGIPKKHQQ